MAFVILLVEIIVYCNVAVRKEHFGYKTSIINWIINCVLYGCDSG